MAKYEQNKEENIYNIKFSSGCNCEIQKAILTIERKQKKKKGLKSKNHIVVYVWKEKIIMKERVCFRNRGEGM